MYFNKKQNHEILCYLSEMRDFLRLNNWDIIFRDDEPSDIKDDDEDVFGMHSPADNHYTMNIWLASFWYDDEKCTNKQRTETVLHELLHTNNRDVATLWDDCVMANPDLSASTSQAWLRDFERHIERMISLWARSLLPYAPQWPGSYTTPSSGVYLRSELGGG